MEIDELKENVDNKAYTDGSYPNMTVGTAKDLYTVQNSAEFEFSHKISEVESESDIAKIENIKGNSVVWNQLINNILRNLSNAWYPRRGVNYASVQNGEIELRFDSQSDAFGNSLRQQIDVRPGDKIYISYDYESHNVDEFGRRVFMAFTAGWSHKAALSDNCLAKGGEVVGHAEGFSVVPSDNSIDTLCIYFCYTNIASPDTTPLKIANFRFVNLTRMFGAGNEPTTIEEYHSRIPQGIDMDAYNNGEVIHMNVDSIKSVGINAWDEEWEQGYVNTEGEDGYSDIDIRSKGYIRVIGGERYYMPYNLASYYPDGDHYFLVQFYDADKNVLGHKTTYGNWGIELWIITMPSDCHYIRFYTNFEGVKYKNDIMISLVHSGWKQDTDAGYQPYWEDIRDTSIIGKYFPDGMKSAGSAHDEIRYNKATQKWEAVKRIGEVDMGTLQWSYSDSTMHLSASVQDLAIESDYYERLNGVICSLYPADTQIGINTNALDKSIKRYQKTIYIRDSSYTDAASFKAAMAGVILYYELANPIVTEIQETFNLDYEVWNGGTEQAIAHVKSTPFKGTIKYGIDSALATIKNNSLEISNLKNRIISDGDEVSNLTLKPGCKIGSFSVNSSDLSSHDDKGHIVISNQDISISSDDYANYTTIRSFGTQIVSVDEGIPAMFITASNGIEIAYPLRNQIVGYAIRAHDGMFAGLRPWVRVIDSSSSSSDKTLTALDHTILINGSSQQSITLPTDPKDGQEYTIMLPLTNTTSVKHIISSDSINIFVPEEGFLKSSLSVDAHGYVKLIYVKDTGFW